MRFCLAFPVAMFALCPLLTFAAPDAATQTKAQQKIAKLTQLQTSAYHSAATYALRIALPSDGELKTRLPQLLEAESERMVKKKDNDLLKTWQQLYLLLQENNATLANEKAESIQQLLTQMEGIIDAEITETSKQAELTNQVTPLKIVKAYNLLELTVILHLTNHIDNVQAQRQLSLLTQQLTHLSTQAMSDTANNEIKEALKKWPVLREALAKNQERNTSFMINHYHEQISDHLMKAYQELQEPKS